jgi:hypothetical protein
VNPDGGARVLFTHVAPMFKSPEPILDLAGAVPATEIAIVEGRAQRAALPR